MAQPGAHFEIYPRGQGEFRWRLLSANNRDSGQSWASFPDLGACQAGLDGLVELLGKLRPLYTPTESQRWQWALALGDVRLARSSRSFDRRLRCVAACDWFVQMAPLASVRTARRARPDPDAVRPLFTRLPLARCRASLTSRGIASLRAVVIFRDRRPAAFPRPVPVRHQFAANT